MVCISCGNGINATDESRSGAMMNGLQTVEQWRSYFGNPSAAVLGLINAIYPIGKIVGLPPATFMADRYGGKTSMWLRLVFANVGAGLQGGSMNLAMFVVSRCFLGLGTAFMSQPSPILISELAYPTHRGKVTALYQTSYVSPMPPFSSPQKGFPRRHSRFVQYFGAIFVA